MNARRGTPSFARIAIALCAFAVVLLLLVPSSILSFLRHRYVWLGRFVDYLELFSSRGVNLTHVFAFAVLGVLAKVALPRSSLWKAILFSIVVGMVTEAAQIWIPGRTPRLWDMVDNTVGVLLGIGIGALLPLGAASRRD